jgi:hypothetical protein
MRARQTIDANSVMNQTQTNFFFAKAGGLVELLLVIGGLVCLVWVDKAMGGVFLGCALAGLFVVPSLFSYALGFRSAMEAWVTVSMTLNQAHEVDDSNERELVKLFGQFYSKGAEHMSDLVRQLPAEQEAKGIMASQRPLPAVRRLQDTLDEAEQYALGGP